MLVRASTIGLHMAKHFALEGHLPLDDRITKNINFIFILYFLNMEIGPLNTKLLNFGITSQRNNNI